MKGGLRKAAPGDEAPQVRNAPLLNSVPDGIPKMLWLPLQRGRTVVEKIPSQGVVQMAYPQLRMADHRPHDSLAFLPTPLPAPPWSRASLHQSNESQQKTGI